MAYWAETKREIDYDVCNHYPNSRSDQHHTQHPGGCSTYPFDRIKKDYEWTSCSPDIINMTYGKPDHWASAMEHGIEYSIMQSAQDADKVIALFTSAAEQGYESPVEIECEVYRQAGVNPENFNDVDKERIQSAVNKLWGVE